MTQVWPRTDDFAREPDVLHPNLTQWIAHLPIVSSSTGLLADHDGDTEPSATDLIGTNPTGWIWRDEMPENCSVEVWTSVAGAAPLGAVNALAFWNAAVCARVRGGVPGGAGTTGARVSSTDCFMLEATLNTGAPPAASLSFTLYYCTSGIKTGIGLFAIPILNGAGIPVAFVDVSKPLGLRLDVFTSGGFAVLWGWISNIDYNGATVQNFKLFGPIASGSFPATIQASPGRAGFQMGQDRVDPLFGLNTWSKAQFFQVREITGTDGSFNPVYGNVILRDEFERNHSGALLSTNAFGASGFCVQSGYMGDQHSGASPGTLIYTGTSLSDRPAVAGTSTSAATVRWIQSRRPPDDPRRQHPQLRWNVNVSTGSVGTMPDLGAGVLVHASGTSLNDSTCFGYAAFLVRKLDVTTAWRFELYRIRSGALEKIAAFDAAFMSAVATTATVYIALEVAPLPGNPSLDGPVRLRVRGGTSFSDITMVVQPGFPGIAADGDYIIDSSSDRITSGAEGLAFFANNTTYRAVFQESSQGALIEPSTGINDLPALVLDGEPTATETINDYARFVLPIEAKNEPFVRDRVRCESGHVWTLAGQFERRRSWSRVETFPMTLVERDAFLVFWRAHATPGHAFFFEDEIKGQTYTVRAVEASLAEKRLFKDAHVFRFDMEEHLA